MCTYHNSLLWQLQVSSLKHTGTSSLRKNEQLLLVAESNDVLLSGVFAKGAEAQSMKFFYMV